MGPTTRGSYYTSSREGSPVRTGSTSRLSRYDYSSTSKPFEFGVSFTPRSRTDSYSSTSNLTPSYPSRLNRSISYTDTSPSYHRQTSNESLASYDRGSTSRHQTSRDRDTSYSRPSRDYSSRSRENLASQHRQQSGPQPGTHVPSSSGKDPKLSRNRSESRTPATAARNPKMATKILTLNMLRIGEPTLTFHSYNRRKKDVTVTLTNGNQCHELKLNVFRRRCTSDGGIARCCCTDRHSSTKRILTDRWHDWIK